MEIFLYSYTESHEIFTKLQIFPRGGVDLPGGLQLAPSPEANNWPVVWMHPDIPGSAKPPKGKHPKPKQ